MYLLFVTITNQFLPFPRPLGFFHVHLSFSLMFLLNFRGHSQSKAIQFQFFCYLCCSILPLFLAVWVNKGILH